MFYFSDYNPKFSSWTYMSFMVAKEYNVRPLEVFTKWESTEVMIAFGILMNNISKEVWANYQSKLNPDRKETPPDSEYSVPFKTLKMVQYEMKNKGN